jgi:hypothetical protein
VIGGCGGLAFDPWSHVLAISAAFGLTIGKDAWLMFRQGGLSPGFNGLSATIGGCVPGIERTAVCGQFDTSSGLGVGLGVGGGIFVGVSGQYGFQL